MIDRRHDSAEEVTTLSDDALLAGARSLVGRERRITAELVAHLAEIESRRLHVREGYSCLFLYCRDALGLSEHEAYGRIEAARAVRRFPLVLELLRCGSITITTVGLLARHLTDENHRGVLESSCGLKKAEVEELVARLRPLADVPASLRKLPATPPTPEVAVGSADTVVTVLNSTPATALAARHAAAARPVPLSPDRYKYQLTIDTETRDLLSRAKDLLRHADPRADDAALLKRVLQLLVAELSRTKFGACRNDGTTRPAASRQRSAAPATNSRHMPAHVKRIVVERDQGRCAFVGRNGHRCDERGFLEFHHAKPYAVGGEASAENIELRCRTHNQYEARLYFARPKWDVGRSAAAGS